MIDVAPLVPEARSPALAAARAYLRHTRPWFVGLLVFGSALKGGVIPGCSDIDFQLYLEEGAFGPEGTLRLETALAIHRDLATIDPAPFQYIQGDALASQPPRQAMALIPGTYHVLAGRLPVPEATRQQVRDHAHAKLSALGAYTFDVPSTLLKHGGGTLQRTVRSLCTDVWLILRRMLALRMDDPLAVWRLPKEDAIALLPASERPGRYIRLFYRSVLEYYPDQDSVEAALKIIEHGVAFLGYAKEWYDNLASDAG